MTGDEPYPEEQEGTQQEPAAADSNLLAKKKLLIMAAAMGAQTLAPGDVRVDQLQPRPINSRLVRGKGDAVAVMINDYDPRDSITVVDVNVTDPALVLDHDTTDPGWHTPSV